jgi:hypothetical protein
MFTPYGNTTGSEAANEGLVTINATMVDQEIEERLHNEATGQLRNTHARTQDEFNIMSGEWLITSLKDGFGDFDNPEIVPVTSTVAGIIDTDTNHVNEVLNNFTPAGIAIASIEYKPDNSMVVPSRQVASKIAGKFTAAANGTDFPFGARIRLVVNQDHISGPGSLGTNKLRIVGVPETDGKPFSWRIQEYCFNTYNSIPDNSTRGPAESAMANFSQQLANYTKLAYLLGKHSGAVNADEAVTDFLNEYQDEDSLIMKQMFTGFGSHLSNGNPIPLNPENLFQYDPNEPVDEYLTSGDRISKQAIRRAILESSSLLFASLADALRMDNRWAPAEVCRGGSEGNVYDGLI